MRNPKKFVGYDRFSWGITATDGPGLRATHQRPAVRFFDYKARSIPYGPDDGTLGAEGLSRRRCRLLRK